MRIITTLLVLSLACIACNQPEQSTSDHHEHALELNGTEKWQISPTMTPHLLEMLEIIDQVNKTDSRDYKTIAADLNAAKNQLVSSCDMKGESHDALHAWLVPYMDLLQELKNAEDKKTGDAVWQKILSSKEDFHQFFELYNPG